MNPRLVVQLVRSLVVVALVIQSTLFVPLWSAPSRPPQVAQAAADDQPLPGVTPTPEFDSPLPTPEITPTPSDESLPTLTPTPTPETETITPSATLPVSTTEALIDARGGRVATPDQRIQVDVPPGVFSRAARLSITPREVVTGLDEVHRPRLEFDLDAFDNVTEARITQFAQPLTLTVNLTGTIDLQRLPEGYYVYLYTLAPDGSQQPVWPIHVNRQANTVAVQITHFSGWGAGVAPGVPGVWEFHYTPPEVDLYSGAATAQIPLQVPAGRQGLQPNLGLSYSSATLNAFQGDSLGSVGWTRGGSLGGFWNLTGIAKIAREKWDTCRWNYTDGGGEHEYIQTCIKDEFTLILGGTGYYLVPETAGQTYGRYYAEGAPGLYVYRKNWCLVHDLDDGECYNYDPNKDPNVPNVSKEYWLIRTAEGQEMRLGYTEDAEQVADGICNPDTEGGEDCKHLTNSNLYLMGYKGEGAPSPDPEAKGSTFKVPRAWWVDTITDTLGNTLTFEYGSYEYNKGERVTPRHIFYNNSANGYLTHIDFIGDDVNPPNSEPVIDQIQMWTKNAGGTDRLVRQYVFTRTKFNRTKWDGSHYVRSDVDVLTSVQEQTQNSGGAWFSLPAHTLTYDWRATNGAYDFRQLTKVDNGYGASTTFSLAPFADASCNPLGCNNYTVLTRTVATTAGAPNMVTTYAYGSACSDYEGAVCVSREVTWCGSRCATNLMVKLVGFDDVTATQWEGATPVARTKHYFRNSNPYHLKGREVKTEQLDPANGNAVLTRQETTWSDQWNGAWFAFASEQTATTYNGAAAASTRSSSSVDGYNNVTASYDYGAEVRVPNAGFEGTLQAWTTWKTTPSCSFTADNSEVAAFAGRWSLRLQGDCHGAVYQDISGLVPNTTYTARVQVRKDTAGDTAGFTLYLYDPAGGTWYSGATSLSTSFSPVNTVFVASASGTARIDLHYWTGSGKIYVDEIAIARASDVGDERSTYKSYHNLTDTENDRWLIGLPWGENIHSGIVPSTAPLSTQTLWYFDDYSYNPANWGQSSQITKGLVTLIGKGVWNTAGQPYVTTQQGYDAWGNTIVMTDTRGNPTRAEYDSQYHLYATAITNALTQTTRYAYDKALGVLSSVTDPNTVTTQFTYDSFGRLKQVIKPGDSITYPTEQYNYYDGGDGEKPLTAWPLQVVHFQRQTANVEGCSGGWGTLERTYYDGLGRVIQHQNSMPDWTCTSGQIAIVNTFYNGRGQVAEQSAPYAVVDTATSGLSHYQTPDHAKPSTKTAYDTLGRTTVITAPDGTLTQHYYTLDVASTVPGDYGITDRTGGLAHVVQDANNHLRQEVSDALGRLRLVREYTGVDTASYHVNPSTRYTYDVVGNLRVVTDALQNTSVMTYDALGRKTSMIDPDMGAWKYGYDLAGNLITQTDAIGNMLGFNYDPLNRVINKRQGDQSGTLLASYTYDQGSNGIGRRSAMACFCQSKSRPFDGRKMGHTVLNRKMVMVEK